MDAYYTIFPHFSIGLKLFEMQNLGKQSKASTVHFLNGYLTKILFVNSGFYSLLSLMRSKEKYINVNIHLFCTISIKYLLQSSHLLEREMLLKVYADNSFSWLRAHETCSGLENEGAQEFQVAGERESIILQFIVS